MALREIAGWLVALFFIGYMTGHASGDASARYDAARARGFHYRERPYACERIKPRQQREIALDQEAK